MLSFVYDHALSLSTFLHYDNHLSLDRDMQSAIHALPNRLLGTPSAKFVAKKFATTVAANPRLANRLIVTKLSAYLNSMFEFKFSL